MAKNRAGDKVRLDKLLVDRGIVETRSKAQAHIMAGEVRVDGEVMTKAGTRFASDVDVTLDRPMPYVSRGGYKLVGALDSFGIDLAGRICADVGACTGGFTDVMLQRGAAHVTAIDVGYGQLAWKLRQNGRVTVMERTNARYVEALATPVNFVAIDVSFISLKIILAAVKKWLDAEFDIIALIKPQFEAGKTQVGKGGIVKDPDVHRAVLSDIATWCVSQSLFPVALMQSPITGSEGNIEFLIWLRAQPTLEFDLATTIIDVLNDTSTERLTEENDGITLEK